MDPHARAFAFVRDRLPALPEDLIISDSELDSDRSQRKTMAGPSTSEARQRNGPTKNISGANSITKTSGKSFRRPPIAGIIELSDDSDSPEVVETIKKHRPLNASRPLPQPNPPRSAVSTNRGPSLGVSLSKEDGSDSDLPSLDLSRFACPTEPSQPKSWATTVQSSVSSTRSSPPPKRPNTRTIHSATDFITDREIDRLARCVACNIAWTTKKTVPKKRYHLRLCQKKNDLTDETVQLLIERELARPVEEEERAKKAKGKLKENTSPKKSITLMNDVVDEAQPKKRGKRKEVPSTIIGIQHQHETIQQHAKRVLALGSDEEDESTLGVSIVAPIQFPLTQEFPGSKLGNGKRFETGPEIGLPSPVPSDDEEVKFYLARRQEADSLQKPISISSGSQSRASGSSSHLSLHGNGRRPHLPSALRQSLTMYNGGDEWMEDLQREIDNRESAAQWQEAQMYDIWEVGGHMGDGFEDRVAGVDEKPAFNSFKPQGKLRRPPKASSMKKSTASRSQVNDRAVDGQAPSFSPVKGKITTKRVGSDSPTKNKLVQVAEVQEQQEFNYIMQERIMRDESLWLRVLRYEPVNFTEFLDMAMVAGVPSKRLTEKLRAFLISRAIHVSMPRERKWR